MHISNHYLAAGHATNPLADNASKGNLNGQRVEMANMPTSLLGHGHSITGHKKSPHLSHVHRHFIPVPFDRSKNMGIRRNTNTDATSNPRFEDETEVFFLSIHQIQSYLDQSKQEYDPDKSLALAKRMLAGDGDPYEIARQSSDDITQQYLLLQLAAREAEKAGAAAATEQREAIYEAIAEMEREFGSHILADLNTVEIAGTYPNREEVANFQTAYRDVVMGEGSLSRTLTTVLARFGDSDFAKGLDNLLKALGRDLAARRPSTDNVRLQAVVQDLSHLAVISTVLASAGVFCKKLLARKKMREQDGSCEADDKTGQHDVGDVVVKHSVQGTGG